MWKSLAPNEREAVFETLDEEVAAEALEELEPKVQKAVVESLDSDRAADIVEEMEPDAAADLLGRPVGRSTEEILVQMQPQERREVSDLLEFGENTAAGAYDHGIHCLAGSGHRARRHRSRCATSMDAWKA